MTNSWWLRASGDRPARSHETWLLASYQLVVRVEKGRQLQGGAAEIAALLGKSDVGQRVVRASGGVEGEAFVIIIGHRLTVTG